MMDILTDNKIREIMMGRSSFLNNYDFINSLTARGYDEKSIDNIYRMIHDKNKVKNNKRLILSIIVYNHKNIDKFSKHIVKILENLPDSHDISVIKKILKNIRAKDKKMYILEYLLSNLSFNKNIRDIIKDNRSDILEEDWDYIFDNMIFYKQNIKEYLKTLKIQVYVYDSKEKIDRAIGKIIKECKNLEDCTLTASKIEELTGDKTKAFELVTNKLNMSTKKEIYKFLKFFLIQSASFDVVKTFLNYIPIADFFSLVFLKIEVPLVVEFDNNFVYNYQVIKENLTKSLIIGEEHGKNIISPVYKDIIQKNLFSFHGYKKTFKDFYNIRTGEKTGPNSDLINNTLKSFLLMVKNHGGIDMALVEANIGKEFIITSGLKRKNQTLQGMDFFNKVCLHLHLIYEDKKNGSILVQVKETQSMEVINYLLIKNPEFFMLYMVGKANKIQDQIVNN